MESKPKKSRYLIAFDKKNGISVDKLKKRMEKEESYYRKESKSLQNLSIVNGKYLLPKKIKSEKSLPQRHEDSQKIPETHPHEKLPKISITKDPFQSHTYARAPLTKARLRILSCENLKHQLNPEFRQRKSQSLKKQGEKLQSQQNQLIKARIRTVKHEKLLNYNRATLKLDNLFKPAKLQEGESLKKYVPEEGYRYLDLNTDCKYISSISQNGVTFEMGKGQIELFSIEKMQKILKICGKIKQIPFFQNFYQEKLFFVWKKETKHRKFNEIRSQIDSKIRHLYPLEIIKIKNLLQNLQNVGTIKMMHFQPLQIKRFKEHLHNISYLSLKQIKENYFQKIAKLILNPFQKEFEFNALQFKNRIQILKSKEPPIQKLKGNKYLTCLRINTNYEDSCDYRRLTYSFQVYLRKIFYILTDHIIIIIKNQLESMSRLMNNNLALYRKEKESYYNYFEQIEEDKKAINPIDSFNWNDLKIEQICLSVHLDSSNKFEIMRDIKEVYIILTEFVDHLLARFDEKNLFMDNENLDQEILKIVSSKIDLYRSNEFLENSKIRKTFHNWISEFLNENLDEIKQAMQRMDSLIQNIRDFINEQTREEEENQQTQLQLKILDRKKFFLHSSKFNQYRQIIKKLPEFIPVGLFNLDFIAVKVKLKNKIDEIEKEMTDFIPKHFDLIADELLTELEYFSREIKISVWTLQDFVSSSLKREEYNEFISRGKFEEKFNTLKDYISFISSINQKMHCEKNTIFLKVRESIKKINMKIQTFDLKKVNKLKEFEKKIEILHQQIWHDLSNLNKDLAHLLNKDKEIENIQLLVSKLPAYEDKLLVLKKQIFIVNFMENAEIQNCVSSKEVSDFSTFNKIRKNLNLLSEFLQKYIKIDNMIKETYDKKIRDARHDIILNELSEILIQTKMYQNSLINFNYLISSIKNRYLEYQKIFFILSELCNFQNRELEDILKKKKVQSKIKGTLCVKDIIELKEDDNFFGIQAILFQKQTKKKFLNLKIEIEEFLKVTTFQKKYKKVQKISIKNHEETQDEIIFYFSNIDELRVILKDFIFQLQMLDQAISQELKEMKDEVNILNINLKELIDFISLLQKAQNTYFCPLKTLNSQDQAFTEFNLEIIEKNKDWIGIIGLLQSKSLEAIIDGIQKTTFLVQSFIKSLNFLQSLLELKIEEKRKQLRYLYFCSDSTVLKIIENPIIFFQQFYPFIYEINECESTIQLKTQCRQVLSLPKEKFKGFKIQKILQKITIAIKDQLVNENFFGEERLLQVEYVENSMRFRGKVESLQNRQIILICNNDIERLVQNFSTLKQIDVSDQIRFDMFISMLTEFRSLIQSEKEFSFENALYYEEEDDEEELKINYVNFIDKIALKYQLIDAKNLTLHFPLSQKMLFNVMSVFQRGEWSIANDSQIVLAILARTFQAHKRIKIMDHNYENVYKLIDKLKKNIMVLIFEDYSSYFKEVCERISMKYFEKQKILKYKADKNEGEKSFPPNQSFVFMVKKYFDFSQLNPFHRVLFRSIKYNPPHWKSLLEHYYLIKETEICNDHHHKKIIKFIDLYETILKEINNRHITVTHAKQLYIFLMGLVKETDQSKIEEGVYSLLKNIQLNEDQVIKNIIHNLNEVLFHENDKDNPTKLFQIMASILNSKNTKNIFKNNKFVAKLNTLYEMASESKIIVLVGAPFSGKSYLCDEFIALYEKKQISKLKIQIKSFNFQSKYLKLESEFEKILNFKDLNESEIGWLIFQGFFTRENIEVSEKVLKDTFESAKFNNKKKNYKNKKDINAFQYLFEVRQLNEITPEIIVYLNILTFNYEDFSQQNLFEDIQKKIDEFNGKDYSHSDQELSPDIADCIKILNQILSTKQLKWEIKPQKYLIVKNSINLFLSYFRKGKGKSKDSIIEHKGKNQKTKLKVCLLYCIYWTVYFCLDEGSRNELDSFFSEICPKQKKLKKIFFNKKLQIHDGEISFTDDIYESKETQNTAIFRGNSIIVQTFEIKLCSYFFQYLYKNNVNTSLIGGSESGKSSFVYYFLNKNGIENNVFFHYRGQSSVREFGKKIHDLSLVNFATTLNFVETFSVKNRRMVYVDDLSFPASSNDFWMYIKYIAENYLFLFEEKLKPLQKINFLIETPKKNFKMDNLWFTFYICFPENKYYFEKIFQVCFQKNNYMIDKSTTLKVNENGTYIGRKYLKLFKTIQSQIQCSIKTWRLNFNFAYLQKILFSINTEDNSNLKAKGDAFEKRMKFYLFCMLNKQEKQRLPPDLLKDINDSSSPSSLFSYKLIHLQNFLMKEGNMNSEIKKNMLKLAYSISISNFILVNRWKVSLKETILDLIMPRLGFVYQKIESITSPHDFQFQILRLSRKVKPHEKVCMTISLETLFAYPEILTYAEDIITKKNDENIIDSLRSENLFLNENEIDKNSVVFIFQTPDIDENMIMKFLKCKRLMNESIRVHFQEPISLDFESMSLRMMMEKYPKKKKEEIYSLLKILIKMHQNIQFMNLPKKFKQEILTYQNFMYLVDSFFEIYYEKKIQLQSKKNSLQTVLSSLLFFFRDYSNLAKDFASSQRNLKELSLRIMTMKRQIDQKSQYLQTYRELNDFNLRNNYLQKIKQKEKNIQLLQEKCLQLKQKTENSFDSITRMELAELKYLFTNNYNRYKEFFQIFAKIFGESLDFQEVKKIITDINIMSRLREYKFEERQMEKVLQIQGLLKELKQKDKHIFTKNIYDWIKYRIEFRKLKLTMGKDINLLEQQITEIKQKISKINSVLRIDETSQELNELNSQFYTSTFTQKTMEIIFKALERNMQISEKIKLFQIYEDICRQNLKQINEFIDCLELSSVIFASELVFSTSLPYNFRKEFRKSNEKFILRNILKKQSNFQIKNPFLNIQNNLISFSYGNLSDEKIKQMILINRSIKQEQQIMIIDPYLNFLEDITNENYSLLSLQDVFHHESEEKGKFETEFIFIQVPNDEWTMKIKIFSENGIEECKILKWKKYEMLIPKNKIIIFLKKKIQEVTDLSKNFKIIHYDFNNRKGYKEQIEKWIINTYLTVRAKQTTSVFDKKKIVFDKKSLLLDQINREICQESNNKFTIKNPSYLLNLALKLEQLIKVEQKQKELKILTFLDYSDKKQIQASSQTIANAFSILEKLQPEDFSYSSFCILKTGVTCTLESQFSKMKQIQTVTYFCLKYLIFLSNNTDNLFSSLFMTCETIQGQNLTSLQLQALNLEPKQLDKFTTLIENMSSEKNYRFASLILESKATKNISIQSKVRKIVINLQKKVQDFQKQKEIIMKQFEEPEKTFFEKVSLQKIFFPKIFQETLFAEQRKMKKNYLNFKKEDMKKILILKNILVLCKTSFYQWFLNSKTYSQSFEIYNLSILTQKKIFETTFNQNKLLILVNDRSSAISEVILKKVSIRKNFILLSEFYPRNYSKDLYVLHINQFLSIFIENDLHCEEFNKIDNLVEFTLKQKSLFERLVSKQFLIQNFKELEKNKNRFQNQALDIIFSLTSLSFYNEKIEKIYFLWRNNPSRVSESTIEKKNTIQWTEIYQRISPCEEISLEEFLKNSNKKMLKLGKNKFIEMLKNENTFFVENKIAKSEKKFLSKKIFETFGVIQKVFKIFQNKEALTVDSLRFYIENKDKLSLKKLRKDILSYLEWQWRKEYVFFDKIKSLESIILLKKIIPSCVQIQKEEKEAIQEKEKSYQFSEDDEEKKSEEIKPQVKKGRKKTRIKTEIKYIFEEQEILIDLKNSRHKTHENKKKPCLIKKLRYRNYCLKVIIENRNASQT